MKPKKIPRHITRYAILNGDIIHWVIFTKIPSQLGSRRRNAPAVWELYTTEDGQEWRWRLWAGNGRIIGSASEGYARRADMQRNAARMGCPVSVHSSRLPLISVSPIKWQWASLSAIEISR